MIDLILYYIILYITYITFQNHITNFTTLFIIVINFIIVIGSSLVCAQPHLLLLLLVSLLLQVNRRRHKLPSRSLLWSFAH